MEDYVTHGMEKSRSARGKYTQKNCHVYKGFKSKWKPDLFSPLSTLVAINRFVQRLAVPGIPKEEFCPDFL